RGLDVAVQLAESVQITQPLGELIQRVTELREIDRRWRRLVVVEERLTEVDRLGGWRVGRDAPCLGVELRRSLRLDTSHRLHEVGADDQLHREEPPVAIREQFVQGDEVRVRDLRETAE